MVRSHLLTAQETALAVIIARMWAGSAAPPWAEAGAGENIIAVGSAAEIPGLVTPRPTTRTTACTI
ncbi:MAG: hypothetical protein ABSH28_11525 [Acidobacteriota bacterium]|jgi:Na+/H+ antiporter NhaC